MSLHGKLLYLFPDWKDGDWDLVRTNGTTQIESWSREEPQPTSAEIAVVTVAQGDNALEAREVSNDVLTQRELVAVIHAVADEIDIPRGVLLAKTSAIYKASR